MLYLQKLFIILFKTKIQTYYNLKKNYFEIPFVRTKKSINVILTSFIKVSKYDSL